MRLFLTTLVLWLGAPLAHAAVDDCTDYLSRHYKRDLKPTQLSFVHSDVAGDIYFPHQDVTLRLRNVGEVAMGGATSQFTRLAVSVAGITKTPRLRMGLTSGGDTLVTFSLPTDTLSHCTPVKVKIDVPRDVGQWGCLVFANDSQELRAIESGGPRCRT